MDRELTDPVIDGAERSGDCAAVNVESDPFGEFSVRERNGARRFTSLPRGTDMWMLRKTTGREIAHGEAA